MLRFWSPLPQFISIMTLSLLGCVECGAQSATAETSGPVVLPANTPVILRLKEDLYKKDAKPGYSLEFEVGYDVVVNGQIAIQSGTTVNGAVRKFNHDGKVAIDFEPVQMISGETVRLAGTSLSSNRESPTGEAAGMGSAAGPILPALMIASLFQKKVLLDKDAWGGVWAVVQTADSVALDRTKQKAAQEQYIANQKAAREELCRLFALPPDSPDWERIGGWEGIRLLARRSGLVDSKKAAFLRKVGDLDGAIEVYLQLLAPSPALPCLEKYPALSFEFFAPPGVVEEGRLLSFFRAVVHLELAGLYREKRDFAHAVTECRMAVQLDPGDEQMRRGLIDTLEDAGELDDSLAEAKEAIQTWPGDPYSHYLLGRVLVKKK